MARSSEEEQRAKRRKRLTRGLLLGTAALGLPALYNVWMARRAQTLALPSWGQARFLETPLGTVAYRHLAADAEAVPLVLLHSLAPGHSSSHWQAVAQRAATNRPVLAIDWPGWGESERRRATYTPAAMAGSLSLVLSTLLEPQREATVVAAGLACVPALAWARGSEHQVRELILVCPRGRRDDRARVRDRILRGFLEMPVVGTSAVHLATSRRALEAQLQMSFADPARIPAQLLDEHERFSHLPGSRHPLTAYFTGRLERDATEDFVGLDRPVHLLWGRKAQIPEIAEADLWINQRDVPLHVIEDAGSLPHLEAPAAFLRSMPG